MKIIEVHKRQIELKDYVRRSALDSDYETLIEESCILVDADTKKTLVVYAQLDLDDEEIMWALNTIRYDQSTRAAGLKTTSRIFGHSPRLALRKDFCSSTSLAQEFPKQHAAVCRYGQRIAGLYENYQPEAYAEHKAILEAKVLDEYKIKDTPFTSGIINKNNPLKYHFDSGNFKDVYSCMVVFKKDVVGGHLSLPEYNVGFKLPHNSVFMFDGQSILHGVTPIKRLSTKAQRYSIVYYSLKQMWNCLPLTEELARIRQVKTERERRRLRVMQGKEQEHPAVIRTMQGGKKRMEKKNG
jgi:hypothetical protein